VINTNIGQMLILLPAVIVGFTLHEFAHAFVAVRLGDETPRLQHRYTLNPLSHISIVGLILILFVGFGWAKPVQFNPANFKRPARDEILVALAGPITNFLLSLLFLLVIWLFFPAGAAPLEGSYGARLAYRLLVAASWVNLLLFLFNLLPIPPLDGSHLLLQAIPDRYAAFKANLTKWGSIVFLVVIVAGVVTKWNVFPIGDVTTWLFQRIAALFFPVG